jgi:hypothetical protein
MSATSKITTRMARAYRCKVRLGDSTGSRIEAQLHLTDLSVYVFHEPERWIVRAL